MPHDPVEHQSIYPEGHDDWRLGITCDECSRFREERRAQNYNGSPLVSGLAVMRDREYKSLSAMEKEAVAEARASGIEPERYHAS